MRKTFIMLAAGAAMAAGPAFAQDSNNGRQNREQARSGSQGPANANQRGIDRSNENSVLNDGMSDGGDMQDKQSMRRQNSQGRNNASDRGRQQANQKSAVREGMMVHDGNNKMVGRVRDVRRAPDGTVIAIVVVLVVQVSGTNVVTIPAGSFTIINNIVVIANLNLNVGG